MKVSKLIHDLHEKVENLEKENVDLKSNVSYSKDDLNRQITNLRIKQKELEKDKVIKPPIDDTSNLSLELERFDVDKNTKN